MNRTQLTPAKNGGTKVKTVEMWQYSLMRDDEREEVERILTQSLHFPPGMMGRWMEWVGTRWWRVVRRQGQIVAGLGLIPTGQWYRGSCVPAAGITAVGVRPELRKKGAATFLLERTMAELREQGMPLAILYPSSWTFYRKLGFERAGTRQRYEILLREMTSGSGRDHLDLIPVTAENERWIEAVHQRYAARTTGCLDRKTFFWPRLRHQEDMPIYGYLVMNGESPEGYILQIHEGIQQPIRIRDLCFVTWRAGERILSFLLDHATMTDRAIWDGGPGHPLLDVMPEPRYRVTQSVDWMLRIVDVEHALRSRGYPKGNKVEVHLAVTDERLPWNHGCWILRVADGVAEVERGGKGSVRIGIHGLAALYTGFRSADHLCMYGQLQASDRERNELNGLFSGPVAQMYELF
jgi:predicted acetyltransferase